MKKVIIVGCPGSGKSTFARKLKDVSGLPLYHLDMLYWNKDKTNVSQEEFMNKLQSVMSGHRWIIDGNYASTMKTRFEACDTVFFLDYPLSVCLDGIESRRGQPRSDMPWIENDCADEEFLNFIKNYNEINRPRVIELIKTHSEKNVIVFHSREEAEEYIKAFQQ